MKKLEFLVGSWSGEAKRLIGAGAPLVQTEEARLKLDGLILTIEGVGRASDSGKLMLQALAIISYDDIGQTYHMRAFNDGRWLETDVKLDEDGKGITWGFELGMAKTESRLKLNAKGEWTEATDLIIGTQPARRFMDLTVRRR